MKPNWKTIKGVHVDLNARTIKSIESIERVADNPDASDKTMQDKYKKARDLHAELGRRIEQAHQLEDTDELKVLRQRLDAAMKKLKNNYDSY